MAETEAPDWSLSHLIHYKDHPRNNIAQDGRSWSSLVEPSKFCSNNRVINTLLVFGHRFWKFLFKYFETSTKEISISFGMSKSKHKFKFQKLYSKSSCQKLEF